MSAVILPLYSLARYDPDLFDGLVLPENLDRETVIDTILLECGHFTPMETDPEFLHSAIAVWSKRRAPIWGKMQDTTTLKYDPLTNYDRTEEWTDNTSGTSTGKSNAEGVEQVQGFDSSSWADRGKNSTSGQSENTASGESKHTGRMYGNIGVTTSQQMLKEQRGVVDYDVPKIIAAEFREKFMIQIY